jgi:dihydrofolate reductase
VPLTAPLTAPLTGEGCGATMTAGGESIVARLVYAALASLDGYVADENGNFDWAAPDEEVHAFVNELQRSAGTQLLGRRMYDALAVWDRIDTGPEQTPVIREFAAIWRATDKVVYSRTLESVSTARTRLERDFEPEAVRALKAGADRDLTVGGPALAEEALRAGLVDEVHLFLSPVVVGGGTRVLPDGLRLDLALVDERRFGNGVVHLAYRVRG